MRLLKIILVTVIVTICLTGCVSQEEKEKANEIIEENRQIIENYVDEYLEGFTLDNIRMIYKSAEFLSLTATNNLEFEVVKDNDTDDEEKECYKYIYCTDTNELYTTYNTEKYRNNLAYKLAIDGVTIETGFSPNYLIDNITVSQDYLHIGNLNDFGEFIEENEISPLSREYTIYLIFETTDRERLIDIYSALDNIKDLNYQVKILIGAEIEEGFIDSYISKDIDDQDSLFDGPASIIKIQNKDGIITESIEKFEKISTDDFWIIYNPLRYKISISKSDNTILGQSNLEESSQDYTISIELLNTNKDGEEFRVISNNYSGIIYVCNESYLTETIHMNKKAILSLSSTCYKDINIEDSCYNHSITIALYN